MGNQGFIYESREFAPTAGTLRGKPGLASCFLAGQPRSVMRIIMAEELQGRATPKLARWLLGKVLVKTGTAGLSCHLITEVEAYDGERDLACHASKGRTGRTEVMYGPGGQWYVYLCYGVHEMLNLVTGPADYPAAVLIRGLATITGPGRVTKQLGIDRTYHGRAAEPATGLHLEDHGHQFKRGQVRSGPRIGVDYAGPVWAAKPWRFWVDDGKAGR